MSETGAKQTPDLRDFRFRYDDDRAEGHHGKDRLIMGAIKLWLENPSIRIANVLIKPL